MPSSKYTGSPTGAGNPPGQYSKSYLTPMESSGHFIDDASYRGSMSVGVNTSAKMVGNQPKKTMSSLEAHANKKNSI